MSRQGSSSLPAILAWPPTSTRRQVSKTDDFDTHMHLTWECIIFGVRFRVSVSVMVRVSVMFRLMVRASVSVLVRVCDRFR